MNEHSRATGWDETTELAAIADPSFEVFFEREKAELYSVLCVVTRNRLEAEELTQDAFVRLLERWDHPHGHAGRRLGAPSLLRVELIHPVGCPTSGRVGRLARSVFPPTQGDSCSLDGCGSIATLQPVEV